MGIGDFFKATENQSLKQRIIELESLLTPEAKSVDASKRALESLNDDLAIGQKDLDKLNSELISVREQLQQAKKDVIETNDAVLMQEFGLYEPKYDFANSDMYKDRLAKIRTEQKRLIQERKATGGNTNWTVNNSKAQGKKMVSDMQKLLTRAFNTECDEVIRKIKFNNIEAGVKRISASKEAISKLGNVMNISITSAYYQLKIDELHLAFEYQVKKQEEKEEQRQIREEMREQAKLRKEIEESRKKIAKDKQHYQNALKQAMEKSQAEKDETKKAALLEKISVFQEQLDKLDSDLKDVDYREANQRAGYVYVISNIGAFGENVYKIGMTRRLDPMDRVDELGDASVPFKFDVHAMIFSDDAPRLEAALHHAFENKKVNLINSRREFFKVSLSEIKQVVKQNFDETVEFIDIPEAEQYRQSVLMAKELQ